MNKEEIIKAALQYAKDKYLRNENKLTLKTFNLLMWRTDYGI